MLADEQRIFLGSMISGCFCVVLFLCFLIYKLVYFVCGFFYDVVKSFSDRL